MQEDEKLKSRIRANQKWERKAYDKFMVRIRKDSEPSAETIRKAAEDSGTSVNGFFLLLFTG